MKERCEWGDEAEMEETNDGRERAGAEVSDCGEVGDAIKAVDYSPLRRDLGSEGRMCSGLSASLAGSGGKTSSGRRPLGRRCLSALRGMDEAGVNFVAGHLGVERRRTLA